MKIPPLILTCATGVATLVSATSMPLRAVANAGGNIRPLLQEPLQVGPLVLGAPVTFAPNVSLYQPIDLAVGPDGAVVMADWGAAELIKVSAGGELIWRVGGKGEGPGEFLTVIRVAIGADGSVIAFDVGKQEISWFHEDGTFRRRARLPVRMRTVESVLLLERGQVAVSGVSSSIGQNGVRVFDAELQFSSSFGPLPAVRNERTLFSWGAGSIRRAETGNILYTRRLPHEVYEFAPDGRLVNVVAAPYEFDKSPDDSVVERVADGGVMVSQAAEFVPRVLPAEDLGSSWLLAGVVTDADFTEGEWSLFYRGKLVATVPIPRGLGGLVAADRDRGFLYFSSRTDDGNRGYVQVPYSIGERSEKAS